MTIDFDKPVSVMVFDEAYYNHMAQKEYRQIIYINGKRLPVTDGQQISNILAVLKFLNIPTNE